MSGQESKNLNAEKKTTEELPVFAPDETSQADEAVEALAGIIDEKTENCGKQSCEPETCNEQSDAEPPHNEQTEKADSPALTPAEQKRLAIKYIIFAAIALAGMYFVQIFHVFAPLFDKIYYGNLTTIFFYACNVIFWIPFIVVLYKQIKKHTGYKVFRRNREEVSLKRSLIIYACALVPIFIVSAALGFEIKVVFELGKKVTGMQLTTNAIMYVHGAVKLILTVIIIELVQEAAQLLYKGKYSEYIPFGGIAACLICGFTDVIVAYGTGLFTMFAWLYVAFNLLYGVIYLLSKKNFFVTYFVSLIIYIL